MTSHDFIPIKYVSRRCSSNPKLENMKFQRFLYEKVGRKRLRKTREALLKGNIDKLKCLYKGKCCPNGGIVKYQKQGRIEC